MTSFIEHSANIICNKSLYYMYIYIYINYGHLYFSGTWTSHFFAVLVGELYPFWTRDNTIGTHQSPTRQIPWHWRWCWSSESKTRQARRNVQRNKKQIHKKSRSLLSYKRYLLWRMWCQYVVFSVQATLNLEKSMQGYFCIAIVSKCMHGFPLDSILI